MKKFKDKIFIEEYQHTDDVNKYIYFSDMFLGLLKFNKRTFKIEYMKVIFKEGHLINNSTNDYIQQFITHTLKRDFLENRAYSVNYVIFNDVAIYKHCDNKIMDLFEPIAIERYFYDHWVDKAREFIATNIGVKTPRVTDTKKVYDKLSELMKSSELFCEDESIKIKIRDIFLCQNNTVPEFILMKTGDNVYEKLSIDNLYYKEPANILLTLDSRVIEASYEILAKYFDENILLVNYNNTICVVDDIGLFVSRKNEKYITFTTGSFKNFRVWNLDAPIFYIKNENTYKKVEL